MPGLSVWHFLAAAIMSSHVAGGVSPIRSLRQIIDHVSPSSGSPYVLASGFASPVWACGYWPYAARKYGSYCVVSMFFLTKSVMSRIDPLVTASPMFWESRTGRSKLVLCAANWVKIASCHCGFGTVLTLIVTFGRVFVYSLPSSSSACAGGHSNHRNVSVIGLFESVCLVGALLAPPPPLSPPQAAMVSAAATAQSDAETVSLPFIAPPPRGLVQLFCTAALRTLHEACRNLRLLCISCQPPSQFLALAITVAYSPGRPGDVRLHSAGVPTFHTTGGRSRGAKGPRARRRRRRRARCDVSDLPPAGGRIPGRRRRLDAA